MVAPRLLVLTGLLAGPLVAAPSVQAQGQPLAWDPGDRVLRYRLELDEGPESEPEGCRLTSSRAISAGDLPGGQPRPPRDLGDLVWGPSRGISQSSTWPLASRPMRVHGTSLLTSTALNGWGPSVRGTRTSSAPTPGLA